MRAVRRQYTAAENQLGQALRSCGLRFATHVPLFSCSPDIVFDADRLVVFVDGDFWHGRALCERGTEALEQSFKLQSRAFWVAKITRNVNRDSLQTRTLRRNGWAVLRLWERDVLGDVDWAKTIVCQALRRRRSRLKRAQGAV